MQDRVRRAASVGTEDGRPGEGDKQSFSLWMLSRKFVRLLLSKTVCTRPLSSSKTQGQGRLTPVDSPLISDLLL